MGFKLYNPYLVKFQQLLLNLFLLLSLPIFCELNLIFHPNFLPLPVKALVALVLLANLLPTNDFLCGAGTVEVAVVPGEAEAATAELPSSLTFELLLLLLLL